MGKPDLQRLFMNPAGQAYRDDGESSLQLAFNRLPVLTTPSQVVASGIPVSGLYVLAASHATASGIVYQRLAQLVLDRSGPVLKRGVFILLQFWISNLNQEVLR